MASESPGRGVAFNGTLSSTPQVTIALSVDQFQQASLQIRGDGSASIAYTVQASNIPASPAEQGPPYRDDSANSRDWATIQTGTVATGTPQSGMITVQVVPYRNIRLSMTSSATPTVQVFAFGTGAPS